MMIKRLTASATLLLGASGVAMAQEELPPLVVFSVQTTPDVVADVVVGDPCVEAVQALRTQRLALREINVIQESFLAFLFNRPGGGAILVCAPEGTETPPPPPPEEPPPGEPPPEEPPPEEPAQ